MYALIKNNTVDNIIVADAMFAATLATEWDAVVALTDAHCGVGWAYADGVFTAREAPPAPPTRRHISVGAFFDRFGAAKYPILASADPGVRALIQDCSVRKFIDLDNPALPYGLAMLGAAGFSVDAGAVVGAVIAEEEKA